MDSRPDASGPGFRARLENLNLWDLIQMECLAGSRKSLLIRSATGAGYLFFEDGQVVHALLGERTGDAAALAMLGWESGEVVACEVPWPRARTVRAAWQSLLMQAAQERDHRNAARPVASARSNAARGDSGVVAIDALTGAPPPTPAGPFAAVACRRRAQLDAAGQVVAEEGPDAEIAGRCAYTLRLAELLGESLALGPLRCFEVRTAEGSVFGYRRPDDGAVVLEPHDAAGRVEVRKALEL